MMLKFQHFFSLLKPQNPFFKEHLGEKVAGNFGKQLVLLFLPSSSAGGDAAITDNMNLCFSATPSSCSATSSSAQKTNILTKKNFKLNTKPNAFRLHKLE